MTSEPQNPRQGQQTEPQQHTQAEVAREAARLFEMADAVGMIETDRFCDGCAGNLHGQSVRRDPRTHLLLARCSSCGTFAAAGDLTTAGNRWMLRFSTVVIFLWMLFVAGVMVINPIAQWADMRRIAKVVHAEKNQTRALVASIEEAKELQKHILAGGYIKNINHPFERFQNSPEQMAEYLVIRQKLIDSRKGIPLSMSWSSVVNAAAGGVLISFVVVVFLPHWRRRLRLLVIVLLPTFIALAYLLYLGARHTGIFSDALFIPLIHAATQVAIGVFGVCVWRPLLRTLTRAFLPATLGKRLVYLWRADGLTQLAHSQAGAK